MLILGAALLYVALAAGFYTAIIATAKEMPDEAAERFDRTEAEWEPRMRRGERTSVAEEDAPESACEHTMRLAS